MIARTVMEADDRSRSQGISQIQGHENNVHVHDDAVSRHTILACCFHQLEVIQDANDRGRDICHQLRRSVGHSLPDDFSMPLRLPQLQ